MKLLNYIVALSAASFLSISCSNDSDEVLSHDEEMIFATFGVSSENSSNTRADLANLGTEFAGFRWNTNDLIAVSADNKNCFHNITVSDPSENANDAKASGKVDKSTGGYLCVYPSNAVGSKIENKKVHVSVPDNQVIEMQHFIAKDALIQVGYASGLGTQIDMHTPCSFLAFNPRTNMIQKVQVEAYKDNAAFGIVGDIQVEISANSTFGEASIGTSTNSVTCAYHDEMTCFPTEKWYAIAIRPGHPDNIKVTVTYMVYDGVKGVQKTKVFNLTSKIGAELKFDRHQYYVLPSFGTLN